MSGHSAIVRFSRLRHATFSSDDPDRLVDYYENVIGLGTIARQSGRIFLGNDSGQLSLVVEPGERAWLRRIAFEIAPDADFPALCRALAEAGLHTELRSDALPGISTTLVFADPEGTEF